MRLAFTKMHGLGNDFIVFDAPAEHRLPSADALRRLADRRTGIGFDQALVLMPPRADGHRRLLSHLQCRRLRGRAVRQRRALHRQPGRAQARTQRGAAWTVPAAASAASCATTACVASTWACRTSIPRRCRSKRRAKPTSIRCASARRSCRSARCRWAIRTRSSKCLRCAPRPWTLSAPPWRIIPAFRSRTNVGFMEVVSPEHIRLRVYERGVGETQACGTGACGAVAVGRRLGLLQEEVQVDAPGRRMIVRWAGPGEHRCGSPVRRSACSRGRWIELR